MKIKRQQDLSESYGTTCDWLKDFAKNYSKEINKKANLESLDQNLREIILHNHKFGTIEDKMQDIKSRIGFDIVKKMHQNSEKLEIEATAEISIEEQKRMVSNILKYIKDMISDKKGRGEELDAYTILSQCREEDGLGFQDLPLDLDKLKEFISSNIKEDEKYNNENSTYIAPEPILSDNTEDYEADYSMHHTPAI